MSERLLASRSLSRPLRWAWHHENEGAFSELLIELMRSDQATVDVPVVPLDEVWAFMVGEPVRQEPEKISAHKSPAEKILRMNLREVEVAGCGGAPAIKRHGTGTTNRGPGQYREIRGRSEIHVHSASRTLHGRERTPEETAPRVEILEDKIHPTANRDLSDSGLKDVDTGMLQNVAEEDIGKAEMGASEWWWSERSI
ncbi:hypothetical protein C8R44DRAFT_754903 [Mycena epipterygia]|nr:hypothetical protein C8R44DRAFT_754903 [Mycena epipterygia]